MHRSRLLSVIAFFMIMVHTLPVMANWAGPDQKVLRKVDNSQTVILSVLTPGGYCYRWSGPNILTDRNQPTIQANPTEEQSIYICLRIGANGVEEDQVVVSLVDEVRIVSVKPKRTCYSPGDPIDLEDFEILTEPKGYEDLVSYSPVQISGGNGLYPTQHNPLVQGNGKWDEVIVFSIDYLENHCEKPLIVSVANPDAQNTVTSHFDFQKGFNYLDIVNELDAIEKALNSSGGSGHRIPHSPSINIGSIDIPWYKYECFNDHVIKLYNLQWGGLSVELGPDFYVPIAVIPGAYFHGNLRFGTTIGQTNFLMTEGYDFFSTEEVHITFSIEGSASASLGLALLNPKFLSVEGGVEGSFSTNCVWIIQKRIVERNPIIFKINGFVEFNAMSFWRTRIPFTIFEFKI